MNLRLRAEDRDDDTVLITLDGVLARDTAQQIPGAVHAAIVR